MAMNFPMTQNYTDVGGSAPSGGVSAQPVNDRASMVNNLAQQYMGGGGGGQQFTTQVTPQSLGQAQQYGQSMQGNIAPGGANATPVGFEGMFPNVGQPQQAGQQIGQGMFAPGQISPLLARILGLAQNGKAPGGMMNHLAQGQQYAQPAMNGGTVDPNFLQSLLQQLLGMR